MININNLSVKSIALPDLKDKNGKWKYDESSEQFGMTVHMQYSKLKNSIKLKGQEVPILIWRNRIVDGRNRSKALDEHNIEEVLVRELPHKTSLADRMELAKGSEYDRRHETPTQLACNAVKEYLRKKAAGVKVKQSEIVKDSLASSANFTNAMWIYKHQPNIFELLFNGEDIKLDNILTHSLSAIKKFYKEREEAMKALTEQRELDEEVAIAELDEIKDDDLVDRNGKLKIYLAIDTLLDPIIESYNLDLKDYLGYKYQQVKNNKESKDTDRSTEKSSGRIMATESKVKTPSVAELMEKNKNKTS